MSEIIANKTFEVVQFLKKDDQKKSFAIIVITAIAGLIIQIIECARNSKKTTAESKAVFNRPGLFRIFRLRQMMRNLPVDVSHEDLESALKSVGASLTEDDVVNMYAASEEAKQNVVGLVMAKQGEMQ